MQVQEVLVWASHARDIANEVGLPFDKGQIDLHKKIFLSLKDDGHTEEEFYARYPEKESKIDRILEGTENTGKG